MFWKRWDGSLLRPGSSFYLGSREVARQTGIKWVRCSRRGTGHAVWSKGDARLNPGVFGLVFLLRGEP